MQIRVDLIFGKVGHAMPVGIAAYCLSAALGLLVIANATPATAQGTVDQRLACMSDAFRLCAEFIPDSIRIEACLKANRRSLSRDCQREVFGGAPRKSKQLEGFSADQP